MTEQAQQAAQPISVADSNQTAFLIAQQSPARDLDQIWTQIENELKFAPEATERTWYSIPYKDKGGRTVPVEGIGVHGADVIARAWGHCAVGGGIREDQGDKVFCRGIYYDHKTNTQKYNEIIVHRYQVGASGKPYRLVGKHWDNAIQSGISKARRNAFLSGVPEFIKDRMLALAKKLTMSDKKGAPALTLREKIEKAKGDFLKRFKISAGVYDAYINGLAVDTDEEMLSHLKGLYSGLTTGEQTIQGVFDVEPDGKPVMKKPEETPTDAATDPAT